MKMNRGVMAEDPFLDKLRDGCLPDWLDETVRHVRRTDFGQVILTIHQGEVIEVQTTEKHRFAPIKGKK